MGLTLTRRRERIDIVEYYRDFNRVAGLGGGYTFPCDKDGTIGPLHPAGAANLAACLAGANGTTDAGIIEARRSYVQPAEGRCPCGATVVLDGDTRGEGIDCDCGRVYNGGGQELAPRSQWDDGRNDY